MTTKENNPKCVLLFSGKRKSGKDYVTNKLVNKLGSEKVTTVTISEPIKSYYAEKYNLNLNELMGTSTYKEKYRADMIKWSDEERAKNPGVFCKKAVENSKVNLKPIMLVTDMRRQTDVVWFKENFDVCKTVRIVAGEDVRKHRGWVFTSGIDDVESECGLDDYKNWNYIIENDNVVKVFNDSFDKLFSDVSMYLK